MDLQTVTTTISITVEMITRVVDDVSMPAIRHGNVRV